ncbi:glycosyltransferase family 4 protein [Flavobacteriales bacterium]|nr:glycosyltransferase family 4 protein [Flavobacteriales bacterium]
MRILYYSPHPNLRIEDQAGYGTHMREMISAFKGLGHEVHILIAGRQTITDDIVKNCQRQNFSSKKFLKTLIPSLIWETIKDLQLVKIDRTNKFQLTQLVAEFNPDIIYERSHYGMVSGVSVAMAQGIHHVLEVNSPNVDERIKLSGKSLLTQRASRKDRWAFAHTDHVLTVSTHLAEYLEITHISKKWSTTPNAIHPGQQEESELDLQRGAFNLDDAAVLLGFVGSIFPWHGVDLIIEAVAQLRQRGRNVQAMVVGDGNIREELEALAESCRITDEIQFIGSVTQRDTFAHTDLCDILIMPKSNAYGSPVKIFEYALAGKPCIVPNTSPVMEVFEHEQDGWVVESSLNAIVSAIEFILDSPEKAEQCAKHWHNKVISKHTWRNNAAVALSKLR